MLWLISSNNTVATIELYMKFMDSNKTYTADQWLSVGEVGHVYQNRQKAFLKLYVFPGHHSIR